MLGLGFLDAFISLILFSLILMLLMQQYLQVKKHALHLQTTLKNNLDRAWVQSLLRDKLHQAGYTPCMSIQHIKVYDHRHPAQVIQPILAGEILQISYMQNFVHADHPWMMISDCFHAEILSAADLRSSNFKYHYPKGYHTGEWVEEQFYVRNNALYYKQHQHSEQLISQIKLFTSKTFQKEGYLWSDITLEFYDETIRFKTRVWSW